jgi:hypothetical protein
MQIEETPMELRLKKTEIEGDRTAFTFHIKGDTYQGHDLRVVVAADGVTTYLVKRFVRGGHGMEEDQEVLRSKFDRFEEVIRELAPTKLLARELGVVA